MTTTVAQPTVTPTKLSVEEFDVKPVVYDRQGVAEFWRIDTERRAVLVARRDTEGALRDLRPLTEHDTLTSPLLPGFSVAVAELFTSR